MATKKGPNAVDKYVGSRIRMRRLQLGLSQSKLADGLGVTFQQVQKYEKGTNRVGASRLQQMSDLLLVPISFFFGEEGREGEGAAKSAAPAPNPVSEFLATSDGLRFVQAAIRIKNKQLLRRLVALVEELVGGE